MKILQKFIDKCTYYRCRGVSGSIEMQEVQSSYNEESLEKQTEKKGKIIFSSSIQYIEYNIIVID